MAKCDCGARYTSMPNMHSDWCEVIRLTSEAVRHNFAMMRFRRIRKGEIEVSIKENDLVIGYVDYAYHRGRFNTGIFRETRQGQDFRSAVLQCLDYLADCINDDRLVDWQIETRDARREYKQNEPPEFVD